MTLEDLKREAARQALDLVRPGMRLGLGTGSTARHFVDLLGERVRSGLDVLCVPTSEATRAQAASLSIPLTTLDETPQLDLTVDGADELDGALRLIKGGGAAHLREKIVACASARMAVIADETKLVQTLGRYPLPLEVVAFGAAATCRRIAAAVAASGCEGDIVQRVRDGVPVRTDGGNLVYDARLGRIADPERLAAALDGVPGLVEHGLFLGIADIAFIAAATGVTVIRRPG